jgi:multicomponent Na+:H+ antiporter subunit F
MSEYDFLDWCVAITLVLLSAGFALSLWRIVRGPSLPDRILALDMLVILGIGFIATVGVMTRYYLYVDIAIALGLVGFLATVAFARFLLHRGEGDEPGGRRPNA